MQELFNVVLTPKSNSEEERLAGREVLALVLLPFLASSHHHALPQA